MRVSGRVVAVLASLFVVLWGNVSPLSAGDWQEFRGPGGRGIVEAGGYPSTWSKETNIKWSVPLPDAGNSSPIVSKGRVFVTCATDSGRQRSLHCFNRQTGATLWVRTVEFAAQEETHSTNPHCAPTPVTDGERVVVWHGSAGIFCYDFAGELLWKRDLGLFHHVWGYASSPILHEGKVLQLCGPGERQFLCALDLKTGETLWQHDEPGGSASKSGRYIGSWATPTIITVDGKPQVLCGLPTRVAAFDPSSGKLLWYCSGVSSDRSDLMYTSPLIGDNFAVAMGGYTGPAMGFELGGNGDVTASNRKWHDGDKPNNPQRIGSGVIVGDVLFMANANDQGSIECKEVKTGKTLWTVRRTADGPHWGSTIFADGRLYAAGQAGVIRVFAPNREAYEEIAVNDFGEQMHATPAFSDGEIFVRTYKHLYCIANQDPAPPNQ
ncbi:MAG: PQQ-binding-like beta-propeller repeat protein [Planctomycetaceae bacterium]